MKISQKKTCEGCKAINEIQGSTMDCKLGYHNKGRYDSFIALPKIEPQEPCPKPKTYKELIDAEEKYKKISQ